VTGKGVQTMKVRMMALLAAVLGVLAASPHAAEKRAMPSLTLVDATGATVTTAALSSEPQWLLIYVSPSAPAADRLIEAMKTWELGTSLRKVVFVVDGRAADTAAWAERRLPRTDENLPPRFLDPKGESRTALRVTGEPTLMGVRNGEIAWVLAGVLNDPTAIEPVIRNWIK
jgi:hypothetical protein